MPTVIPDENDDIGEDGTYWGYTSVPPDKVAWWRALPLVAAQPSKAGGR